MMSTSTGLRFAPAFAALALALNAMSVSAQTPAEDQDRAEQERRLAEAQRKLEEAAQEVAELSVDMVGPIVEEVRRIRIGSPSRAMIGVNLGAPDPGSAGARVVSVSPGGPAAEAGVLAGDLIVSVDGAKVGSGRDLVRRMREVEPGQKLDLGLRRGDKPVSVVLVARASDEMVWMGDGPDAPMPPRGFGRLAFGPWSDMELASLTPSLGKYFGTDKGLLVVRSPSEGRSGLEDGDVILSIGGREPTGASHALRIFGSYEPGEQVEVQIMRQRKRQTLKVTIPERTAIFRGMPPVPPSPPVPSAPRPAPPPGG